MVDWQDEEIMRLNNLLVEEQQKPLNEAKVLAFVDLIKLLHKDCKPFLNEWAKPQKGHRDILFMFSGRKSSKDFEKKSVRMNRTPVDTHPLVHKALDDAFEKKFGHRARSNSMFCTGSVVTAKSYGDPYMIFPIGKYRYLWSESHKDLYSDLSATYDIGRTALSGDNGSDNPWINGRVGDLSRKHNIIEEMEAAYNEWKKDNGHWVVTLDNGVDVDIPEEYNKRPMVWLKAKHPNQIKKPWMDWYPYLTFASYREKYYKKYHDERQERFLAQAEMEFLDVMGRVAQDYQKTELVKGLEMQKEIMLTCKEYYMLTIENGTRLTMEAYFTKFGNTLPKDDDLYYWAYHNGGWGLGPNK